MEFKFSGMKRGEFGEEKWGEGKCPASPIWI